MPKVIFFVIKEHDFSNPLDKFEKIYYGLASDCISKTSKTGK